MLIVTSEVDDIIEPSEVGLVRVSELVSKVVLKATSGNEVLDSVVASLGVVEETVMRAYE